MIDKQVVVATKCRAAKRVGGFLTKYQVAIIYQFYRSVLCLNELLPHALRPVARIKPLLGIRSAGDQNKASLSKSPVASNVGYSPPPAPSIVVSEFPLFPPILRVRGAGLPSVATRYSIIVHLCRKLVCLSLCLRRV